MPVSSPGMNCCGAFLSGWYNDTLPTTANDITNGTVCFDTYSGSCMLTVDISVVFCSTYYVFFLPPLNMCDARYCTTQFYYVLAEVSGVAWEIQYFMLDILENGSLLLSYKLPILCITKCARIPFAFQAFFDFRMLFFSFYGFL